MFGLEFVLSELDGREQCLAKRSLPTAYAAMRDLLRTPKTICCELRICRASMSNLSFLRQLCSAVSSGNGDAMDDPERKSSSGDESNMFPPPRDHPVFCAVHQLLAKQKLTHDNLFFFKPTGILGIRRRMP